MTAQPKPTAADVLRKHTRCTWNGSIGDQRTTCGAPMPPALDPDFTIAHQADMLAAAGLLATAEPVVIEVHHHDIEKHAESFNEGYETAVAQGLADDPTLAADWLAEHDAQVLRDAAKAIGHAPGCHPDPDRDPYYGCACRISLIYARADRLAGGNP